MPRIKPPSNSRVVFARNLRRARRLKDLSQETLALDAGVPRGYLSRVERGTVNISIDNADALSRAIGVPLHDLVDPEKFKVLDDE